MMILDYWFHHLGLIISNSTYQSRIINADNGTQLSLGEHTGGCCGGTSIAVNLFNALGWSGHSSSSNGSTYSENRMLPSIPLLHIQFMDSLQHDADHISCCSRLLTIPVYYWLNRRYGLHLWPTATGLSGTLIGLLILTLGATLITLIDSQECRLSQCPTGPCDNKSVVEWKAILKYSGHSHLQFV